MEYHSLSCKFTGFDNLTKIRVPFFSKTPSELSCFSCYQAMFPFVILRYRSLHIRDSELDSIERFKKEQTNIFQSYSAIFINDNENRGQVLRLWKDEEPKGDFVGCNGVNWFDEFICNFLYIWLAASMFYLSTSLFVFVFVFKFVFVFVS